MISAQPHTIWFESPEPATSKSPDQVTGQVTVCHWLDTIPDNNFELWLRPTLTTLANQTHSSHLSVLLVSHFNSSLVLPSMASRLDELTPWLNEQAQNFKSLQLIATDATEESDALRLATALAQTPYIFILQSRALLYPKCIERCLSVLATTPDAAISYPIARQRGSSNLPSSLPSHHSALVRTSALANIGGYPTFPASSFHQANPLDHPLMVAGSQSIAIPEILITLNHEVPQNTPSSIVQDPATALSPLSTDEPTQESLSGYLEPFTGQKITGWVLHSDKNQPPELDFYIDQQKITLPRRIPTIPSQTQAAQTLDNTTVFDIDLSHILSIRPYFLQRELTITLKGSSDPILGTPQISRSLAGQVEALHQAAQATRANLSLPLAQQQTSLRDLTHRIDELRHTSHLPSPKVFNSTQVCDTVDVVIPVYRNETITRLCINSVLQAKNDTPFRVVVIDDCSPEPQLSEYLKTLAQEERIDLIVNAENLGFVKSVNKGMQHSAHQDISSKNPQALPHDVILLNADAIVSDAWIDRLKVAVYSAPNIASATPLSNSATIFTYPAIVEEHDDLPHDLDLNALNELFHHFNAGIAVDVPTCHGFCCFLRRAALNDVGYFDADKWAKGYGEEVDWSQQALRLGWKHIAVPGIFVQHFGSQSFLESKNQYLKRALTLLSQAYPDYDARVQAFIAQDLLAPYRRRVDIQRLINFSQAQDKPYILHICHHRGGGTAHHLHDISQRLISDGYHPLVIRPEQQVNQVRISSWLLKTIAAKYDLGQVNDQQALLSDLHLLNIQHIHIHSTLGFADADWIWQLATNLGIAYDVTIHDYQSICPRLNLVDATGMYCQEPDVKACNQCIDQNGLAEDINIYQLYHQVGSVEQWRTYFQTQLAGARRVFAPSQDTYNRMQRYFSLDNLFLRPHPQDASHTVLKSSITDNATPYRIALIGALSDIKGFEILKRCALHSLRHQLPLEFYVFGYTKRDTDFASFSNVTILGQYQDEATLQQTFMHHPCDIAAFFSTWPETYGYTLSEALRLGLLPVAFNLGAVAERTKDILDMLILDLYSSPEIITSRLMQVAKYAREASNSIPLDIAQPYSYFMQDYYEVLTKTGTILYNNT
jgi:GT2 family glycosyltransferase